MITLRIKDKSEQAEAFIEFAKTLPYVALEEEGPEVHLTEEQKAVLDERLEEDQETYLTENAFFDQLKRRYGV